MRYFPWSGNLYVVARQYFMHKIGHVSEGMKRFFKIFLICIICAGAGLALYYFYPRPPVEIATVAPDGPSQTIAEPDAETEPAVIDDDIDDDAEPAATAGWGGYRLEFRGTKLGTTVGRATINFSDDGQGYEIRVSARPAGVLRQIFSERIQLRATGKYRDGKMNVEQFQNVTVKDDKKQTKKEKLHAPGGPVKYTRYGKEKEIDEKIFDAAADPLTLLFHIGRTIDSTGKCNLVHNGFIDETGFSATITDKGKASETGIKVKNKKISEIRCDVVLKNRAGKVMKDYPFGHEFAKKGAKVRANMISVYYSKMGGDRFVPVLIKVRDTGIGEINVKLTSKKAN